MWFVFLICIAGLITIKLNLSKNENCYLIKKIYYKIYIYLYLHNKFGSRTQNTSIQFNSIIYCIIIYVDKSNDKSNILNK